MNKRGSSHGMMAQQHPSSSQAQPFLGGLTMLAIVEDAAMDPAGGMVVGFGQWCVTG